MSKREFFFHLCRKITGIFLVILFFIIIANSSGSCRILPGKQSKIAVLNEYPDKKEEQDILKGKEPERIKIDQEKVSEDLKMLQKILPKNSKIKEAEVSDYSARYVIRGIKKFKKGQSPLQVLIQLARKFKQVNFLPFINLERIELADYEKQNIFLVAFNLIYDRDLNVKNRKKLINIQDQLAFFEKLAAIKSVKTKNITFTCFDIKNEGKIFSISGNVQSKKGGEYMRIFLAFVEEIKKSKFEINHIHMGPCIPMDNLFRYFTIELKKR